MPDFQVVWDNSKLLKIQSIEEKWWSNRSWEKTSIFKQWKTECLKNSNVAVLKLQWVTPRLGSWAIYSPWSTYPKAHLFCDLKGKFLHNVRGSHVSLWWKQMYFHHVMNLHVITRWKREYKVLGKVERSGSLEHFTLRPLPCLWLGSSR